MLITYLPPPPPPFPNHSVSGTILQYFSCIKLGDNFWVMRYSQTTQCYTAEYNAYYGYAIAMIFVYPVGVPLAFLAILWRLARTGTLDSTVARARFGFLYETYEPHMWAFEVFELIRKLFLSAIAVFIFSGTPTQLMVSQFVAVVRRPNKRATSATSSTSRRLLW